MAIVVMVLDFIKEFDLDCYCFPYRRILLIKKLSLNPKVWLK